MSHCLAAALSAALSAPDSSVVWAPSPRATLGDLSTVAALGAARVPGTSPAVLAAQWASALERHPWVAAATSTAAGHLNLTLSGAGWQALLAEVNTPMVLTPSAMPQRVLLEFVSANPTGPLHIGHARQAALGDALAHLLRAKGHEVVTEFFYNDAGSQIDHLVASVKARWEETHGRTTFHDPPEGVAQNQLPALPIGHQWFPADGYRGAYVIELAKQFPAPGSPIDPGPSDLAIRNCVIPILQKEQFESLAQFGVAFDGWVSEADLHACGAVSAVVSRWRSLGHTFDIAGQVWLATTRWGDDKDRVAVRENGQTTYFVPDVAYHRQKWARGFSRALNIQGADHHGTLARVRAGLQALDEGIALNFPEVRFHTMVKILRNGVAVALSKRSGGATPMDDALSAIGPTALRLLLLARRPESEIVLDLDRAMTPGPDNPAYTVQYAHARLCAVLDRLPPDHGGQVEAGLLLPAERALVLAIWTCRARLDAAANDEAPHAVVSALVDLSKAVHAAYQQGPRAVTLSGPEQSLRTRVYTAARATLFDGAGLVGALLPRRLGPNPGDRQPIGPGSIVSPRP